MHAVIAPNANSGFSVTRGGTPVLLLNAADARTGEGAALIRRNHREGPRARIDWWPFMTWLLERGPFASRTSESNVAAPVVPAQPCLVTDRRRDARQGRVGAGSGDRCARSIHRFSSRGKENPTDRCTA